MSIKERLDQLEASHIHLMTEHELAVKENDRAWEKNRESWDRHFEWLSRFEARRDQESADLDERITALVSAIGGLIALGGK